jgi:hypothetical protein
MMALLVTASDPRMVPRMVCGLKNFQNAARKDVLALVSDEPSKAGPSAVAAWAASDGVD